MLARRFLLPIVVLLVPLAGCDPSLWNKKQPTTRPAGTMSADAGRGRVSVATEGTVGSAAYLQGARFMRVHGYGLVVGLNGKGSRNVRPGVRDQVLKDLRRYLFNIERSDSRDPRLVPKALTAGEILSSPDSAVVEVTGDIPAGAAVDQHFDVTVRADDSETQSLAGGYLIRCDLRIYQEEASGSSKEGRIHAEAGGAVFINPFVGSPVRLSAAESQPSGGVSLREGRIIGGGINKLSRRLSLSTIVESYATVCAVRDAINTHFSGDTKYADATNPTNVDLKVPPEYANDRQRFIELVMHLPLASSPIQREARIRALVAELNRPDAPMEDTALSLEALGKSATLSLKPLYTDPRRQVNYYAARIGMRLGDELAIDVIARHATQPGDPHRTKAIRELGYCKDPVRASLVLHQLLNEPDARIRILAYEALRKVDPESIPQFMVGERPQNFLLEVVPSDGPPLIYAHRTESRRLALIGGDQMVFRPPLLYAQPGQPVTLSAPATAKVVQLMRKNVGGRSVGPWEMPLAVIPLVRFLGNNLRGGVESRVEGLGLDYSTVIDVLYRLCAKGAINADLRWDEPSVEDILGPLEPVGRPESEL